MVVSERRRANDRSKKSPPKCRHAEAAQPCSRAGFADQLAEIRRLLRVRSRRVHLLGRMLLAQHLNQSAHVLSEWRAPRFPAGSPHEQASFSTTRRACGTASVPIRLQRAVQLLMRAAGYELSSGPETGEDSASGDTPNGRRLRLHAHSQVRYTLASVDELSARAKSSAARGPV